MLVKRGAQAWNSRVKKTKGSYYVLIPKDIALGNRLEKGETLTQYLMEVEGRYAVLTLLKEIKFYKLPSTQT